MKVYAWSALISLASIGGIASAAPLEAYARLPLYENVAISPDGKIIAFVTTVGEKREAIIQSFFDG